MILLSCLVLLLRVDPALGRGVDCLDDEDCSLNGLCDVGICSCDRGWKGQQCNVLDLLPVVEGTGYDLLSPGGNFTSSWGGAVLQGDDGVYHMWAAEMEFSCGINSWLQNSVVIHATSRDPQGVYERRETLFPIFSHEPDVVRAPEGEYVIFFTHQQPPPVYGGWKTVCHCSDGNSTSDCPPDWDEKGGRDWTVTLPTYMSWTRNPSDSSTWSEPVLIRSSDPYVDTNLAMVILKNGSAVGMYRSGDGPHLVTALNWKDSASYHEFTEGLDLNDWGEDPFLWLDARGRFHCLTHSDCGKHFYSKDGWIWKGGGDSCAFPRENVTYSDGRVYSFGRRERPHLVFAADGCTPIALTTGVTAPPTEYVGNPPKKRWPDACHTLLQSIRN